ncbi:hypothetical protein CALCODRAFT_259470 [Calocera cornea HHB12733]|uniref:Uncharacterized protein n=1 Tax=Calocera cornea HHB12733 TaxID=1353952 RepID=A0A165GHB6_9BASI|nr:hypothetical protein CALCODRAFT_259470 [Calocera cornea HHB12733]
MPPEELCTPTPPRRASLKFGAMLLQAFPLPPSVLVPKGHLPRPTCTHIPTALTTPDSCSPTATTNQPPHHAVHGCPPPAHPPHPRKGAHRQGHHAHRPRPPLHHRGHRHPHTLRPQAPPACRDRRLTPRDGLEEAAQHAQVGRLHRPHSPRQGRAGPLRAEEEHDPIPGAPRSSSHSPSPVLTPQQDMPDEKWEAQLYAHQNRSLHALPVATVHFSAQVVEIPALPKQHVPAEEPSVGHIPRRAHTMSIRPKRKPVPSLYALDPDAAPLLIPLPPSPALSACLELEDAEIAQLAL